MASANHATQSPRREFTVKGPCRGAGVLHARARAAAEMTAARAAVCDSKNEESFECHAGVAVLPLKACQGFKRLHLAGPPVDQSAFDRRHRCGTSHAIPGIGGQIFGRAGKLGTDSQQIASEHLLGISAFASLRLYLQEYSELTCSLSRLWRPAAYLAEYMCCGVASYGFGFAISPPFLYDKWIPEGFDPPSVVLHSPHRRGAFPSGRGPPASLPFIHCLGMSSHIL
jgi:hypothetical protein